VASGAYSSGRKPAYCCHAANYLTRMRWRTADSPDHLPLRDIQNSSRTLCSRCLARTATLISPHAPRYLLSWNILLLALTTQAAMRVPVGRNHRDAERYCL